MSYMPAPPRHPYPPYDRRPPRPHRGEMILVFGILSWVICIFFGVAAWVMANRDLQEMALGRMDASGRGLTEAGRILGMIHVIVALAAAVVFGFIALVVILSSAGAHHY